MKQYAIKSFTNNHFDQRRTHMHPDTQVVFQLKPNVFAIAYSNDNTTFNNIVHIVIY